MDEEAKLPVRAAASRTSIRSVGPSNADTSSSSNSSTLSSSYPSPELIRDAIAYFKRQRPNGPMASKDLRPRRMFAPVRNLGPAAASTGGSEKLQETSSSSEDCATKESIVQRLKKENMVSVSKETQEDASITQSSLSAATTNPSDGCFSTVDVQMNQQKCSTDSLEKNLMPLSHAESPIDPLKKVHFSAEDNVISQGVHEREATGLRNLSSHVNSLALTEMEWNSSGQMEASTALNHDLKQETLPNSEFGVTLKPDVAMSSSLAKRTEAVQDQLQQFRNFVNQPATQCLGMNTSCATTTSVHPTSVPMLNSTYTSRSNQDEESHMAVEHLGDSNLNHEPINQGQMMQLPGPSLSKTGLISGQVAITAQASMSSIAIAAENNRYNVSKEAMQKMEMESVSPKNLSSNDDKAVESKRSFGDVTNVNSQAPLTRESSMDTKREPSQTGKLEKVGSSKGAAAPRKRNHDPDHFFKVNGKLYQRLGKIGSGGSSEVHKVISSDCTIYALKKIKLKGRDYMTAYGFCQEIEYLNKLKGKNNIIQLIDYEVTDKSLLHEVMNGTMNNKDGRLKDDAYIYMVLEYGEIDLAHMLSQKWRELDVSETIDENWLRFYWQQILQAVNTIHEERIVHSDLKPANFLLVKGSLKLIDFGIAKALMSDTTNIQRDSQVGTLSYMSPEAFLCNETDSNGNVIKCGRPSDIWSLGCILYQMVYGRTPFSDYKTFWSKFKVITDPNHEIQYEPIPNPWLLDIMKKCLAWDRNKRWRIPQLLQHPFLVPPVPVLSQVPLGNPMIQLISEACKDDEEASGLCGQLRKLVEDPTSVVKSQSVNSRDQQCLLLSQMSRLCFQIRQRLVKSETNR